MTGSTQRRLAAVVSTDVVGYSRLMGADEADTLARMKAHRQELWNPEIEKHGGRIVGTAGDSLLVEFASAVSAVECSLAVQQGMAAREADRPDHRRMLLRVGINIGEVVVDGDDIFGDGVNVAARLQAIAPAGGICLSGKVHDEIEGKIAAIFEDAGVQEVKNIARPVRVWRWSGMDKSSSAPQAATSPPGKPSIAVLPFNNMSADPDQEYFSDGVSEDIITALSKASWLTVIARNSSFTYKGRAVDVKQVGRELGVAYVLEGSIRKAGNRVRITAQLISTLGGDHVWAERYDRELDDIFALQDEITETIVARIDSEVRVNEIEIARRKPPANMTAWDLYQKGMWHFYRMAGQSENETARQLFEQSITADPGFAPAHAGIAYARYMEVFHGYTSDSAASVALGVAAGERAVSLDGRSDFAHFVLGRVLVMAGQFDRAIAELERSVAINPSYAHGLYGLATALYWNGRAEEAMPKFEHAMRLSPRDPLFWGMLCYRGVCSIVLDRYDEAIDWIRKAINEMPEHFWPHLLHAMALAGLDRLDDAGRAIDQARRINPDFSIATVVATAPNAYPDYMERIRRLLTKAGLPE